MATNNSSGWGDSARVFTGVATWTGSGNYFDDTTPGSFTLSRGGTGYVKNKPVTWAGGQTTTGMAQGNCYYIYVDATGTIGKTTSRSTAFNGDYITLFECLYDSVSPTGNQITVKEDHPYQIPIATSEYLHDSIGCIVENHNNGANITLNGTQKIQISGDDEIEDHGLDTEILDIGNTAVVWRKKYLNGSGKWCLYETSDTFTSKWNDAGTVSDLGGSKFGVYTLYASKDNKQTMYASPYDTTPTPIFFAVINNAQYNNLAAAQTAISSGSVQKATNELAQLELVQLGYIIYASGTPGSIAQVIIAKSTFAASVTQAGTNTASLINLSTTNFDGILSSADTNVQAALETIDDFSKAPFAQADHGTGLSGKTMLTNVVNTTQGAGALTMLSTNANSGTNAGFIKMYVGTTVVYIPYFTSIAP